MSASGLYRRLHFYVGNGVRAATMPWRAFRIAPDEARSVFACSFGANGWHPLRRTLEEYDADPAIDVRETTLYRYLTSFTPASICDLAAWPEGEAPLPLFVYPWGTFRRGEISSAKVAARSRFCGPSEPAFVAEEFERTIRLYEELRIHGYRPWRFGHTFVGGTMLFRANGERRFVVLQGNHRLAILAHLGLDPIVVRDVPGFLRRVDEADVTRWPLVAAGRVSSDAALRVFNLFFEADGRHIQGSLERVSSRQFQA